LFANEFNFVEKIIIPCHIDRVFSMKNAFVRGVVSLEGCSMTFMNYIVKIHPIVIPMKWNKKKINHALSQM